MPAARRKTGKTSSTDTNQSLLKKILCRENVVAATVIGAAISSAFLYFSHTNHVVGAVETHDLRVDDSAAGLLTVPMKVRIRNLSDGPITLNGMMLGFPKERNGKGNCENWMTIGKRANVDEIRYLDPQQTILVEGEFSIPHAWLPSDVCLVTWWRDQNEYQRQYLSSIGRYESYVEFPLENGNISVIANGSLKDIIAVFPRQNCLLLFSREMCF